MFGKRFWLGESLEDDHHRATLRTMPDRGVGLGSLGCGGRQGSVRQQLPAELDSRGTKAIGQKAEVTDAHEAFGQDMQEEAA